MLIEKKIGGLRGHAFGQTEFVIVTVKPRLHVKAGVELIILFGVDVGVCLCCLFIRQLPAESTS
jgi:tetrahydromethanopterin S-methyltransferase subunit G